MASKIIGQNQVRDSTITENLQKASHNGDDVEASLMSDELQFLTKYDVGFFKDQKFITENLQKSSENGDDV